MTTRTSTNDWPAPDPERLRRVEHQLAMVRVGEEIRRLREARGMTLRALAQKLDVSAPYMSDVEHGRRALAHERLIDVAAHLRTTPKKLADVAGVCTHCMGSGYAPRPEEKRR